MDKDKVPGDLWHPIEKKWIKKDGLVTEWGKQYYAGIARDIENKRKERRRLERMANRAAYAGEIE